MMNFKITHNFADVLKKIDGHQRRLKLATAKALTFTGEAVRNDLKREMGRVFDRPTPYTVNSLYLKPATVESLTAEVGIKKANTGAWHYIHPQIHGGRRQQKGFERVFNLIGVKAGVATRNAAYIVPGSAARLDAYGNISRGQIRQILSALGKAEHTSGYSANRTAASAKRKGGKLTHYFLGSPGGGRLPFGVWQRFGFSRGSAIKPVLIFIKNPNYKKRFDFHGIAQRVSTKVFPEKLARELQRASNAHSSHG